MQKIAALFLVALAACFASFWATDQLMGLMGYPRELPIQIAHPPHVAQQIKNLEFAYEFKTNDLGLRYQGNITEKGRKFITNLMNIGRRRATPSPPV